MNRKKTAILLLALMICIFSACSQDKEETKATEVTETISVETTEASTLPAEETTSNTYPREHYYSSSRSQTTEGRQYTQPSSGYYHRFIDQGKNMVDGKHYGN